MDASEATNMVRSRIQSFDPENCSRIIGLILIQEQGEKEMIRLAFCPETHLLAYVNKAKAILGISPSAPSSNLPPSLSNTVAVNDPFANNSSRIMVPNQEFHFTNPCSPVTTFPRSSPRPFSYAAVVNGSDTSASCTNDVSGSASLQFYRENNLGEDNLGNSVGGAGRRQFPDQFQLLDDSEANPILCPQPFHGRSCSVNDANLGEVRGDSGFSCRPCTSCFARGFCNNGSSCKFLQRDICRQKGVEISPFQNVSRLDEFELQRKKFGLMAGHHQFKDINFLNENQRLATTPLTMEDAFQKFNRCGLDRNDLLSMRLNACFESSARQIYLTFPADSTFKEEDVSKYFSEFGPVQDVRIPYQLKRMFGFVTFAYVETVKLILAKGNPHFVCDSRVLVKPYKEKGKVSDKKHQLMEIGEYGACLSPSELDSRERFDIPFGPRMLLNSQETMLRRKLEEVEIQHALELQGRMMMNLQLNDLKNQQRRNQFMPNQFAGVSISSPRLSQSLIGSNLMVSPNAISHEAKEEFDEGEEDGTSQHVTADDFKVLSQGTQAVSNNNVDSGFTRETRNSLGYALPDHLFSSPTNFSAENQTAVSFPALTEADDNTPVTNTFSNTNSTLTSASTLSMASLKTHYPQMPRRH